MNYYSVSRLIGSSDAAELICSLTGKSREWLMLNRDWELPGNVADAAHGAGHNVMRRPRGSSPPALRFNI